MFAGHDPVSRRLAAVGQEFGHGFALDLSRILAVLAALGDPHLRLAPTVHVAGTNGKGSTCAFLRAIGEAAGLRVHVFTSPHLVRPNERVRLAGRLVEDDAFIAAIDRVAATGLIVTYFEAVTAAAFLLFAETPADLVVLEVGMGGRHDATNVIPQPAVSVICPIDFDHQAFLGDTLDMIAGEKAGILKPGRPAVIARQAPHALARIEAEAARVGASLLQAGVAFDAFPTPTGMALQTETQFFDLPAPALFGPHQIDNAALAAMAALTLADPRLDRAAIAAGLARATWPARMQPLTRGPLAAIAQAAGAELWLDGGHNPHAGRALAAAVAQLDQRRPAAATTLIVGMLRTKDASGFLAPLRAVADTLIAVPVPGSDAARAPEDLAAEARAQGFAAAPVADIHEAVRRAAKPNARVLICGSLYLAGDVLSVSGGGA